jgi:peptidoglycan/LPS O-acetylase OafA/YrhL
LQTGASVNRFAGLDHLRALAIIIVFAYHYSVMAGSPAHLYDYGGSFGWTGVDLFFVLSGFLIGGQLFSKLSRDLTISYGEFYFKRFLRIVPAYLFVLALYYAIPGFKERGELPPLWRMLTFTQNFGLDLTHHGAFSHAWSLCIEEQFYLILPLFIISLSAVKAHKKAIWLLPALFIFGFAARLFSWYHLIAPHLQTPGHEGFGKAYYMYIYYPTYTRLDGLLAGVTLAAFYHFQPARWSSITKHGNRIFLLGLLLLAAAWWISHDANQYSFQGAIFGYPLISLAYGVLVLAALSPTCFLYRYSSKTTSLIATLSYSIYLTHKQLNHLVHLFLEKHGFEKDGYAIFWICVLVSFLCGWLLHLIIEKPFLRLRDRILARSKKAALQPASSTPNL